MESTSHLFGDEEEVPGEAHDVPGQRRVPRPPAVGGALLAGGLRETVIDGHTGLLVAPDDLDGLARALRRDLEGFEPLAIREHAERFSRPVFQARIGEIVAATCSGDAR